MSEGVQTCPICGGTDFSWGNLQNGNDVNPVGFRPDEDGMLKRVFGSAAQVSVRHCQGCDNLQLFLQR